MKIPLLLACFSVLLVLPVSAKPSAGSAEDLRDGFYLLHEVCHEETQVSLITLIKTTPPNVTDYVKRISSLAKESEATLDRLRDHDSSLRDAEDPLPPFERATRSSIRADKQHLLLFGSKGSTFAKRLIFTQIEASNYILHLSKVWADRDPDADRAATLRKMSAQWLKIREEGFRLLDES
jgi:hypothetical protein